MYQNVSKSIKMSHCRCALCFSFFVASMRLGTGTGTFLARCIDSQGTEAKASHAMPGVHKAQECVDGRRVDGMCT